MKINWLRWNMRVPVLIQVDLQGNDYYRIYSICERLVGGSFEVCYVPPRGIEIMLYNRRHDDRNVQASGIAGMPITGDVVIIDPDVWALIKGRE